MILSPALLSALLLAAAPAPAAGPADTRSDRARFEACVQLTDSDPAAAEHNAADWARNGGGIAAAQCLGIARTAAGNWKGAIDAFSTAATLAGQTHAGTAGNLWASAGDAALAGGDAVQARALLTTALGSPDLVGQMKGEAYLDRARAEVAAADLVAARGDMDEAVAMVPDDPMAWLLSATLARRMKDLPRATTDIGQAQTRSPADADILVEAGNIAAAGGDTAGARKNWSHVLVTAAPDSDAIREARAKLMDTGGIPASATAVGR